MPSGIYQIKNQISGKHYIGSAINIQERWKQHLRSLRRGCHHNQHLQRAFDRYGKAIFVFSILEAIEPQTLLVREQYFVDMLNPEYNIAPVAGSPMLGRHHTLEACQKMSETLTGRRHSAEHKRNLSEAARGRRLSAETRQKISEAHKGKHHSMETRVKMSEAQKGKCHSEATRRKISMARRSQKVCFYEGG